MDIISIHFDKNTYCFMSEYPNLTNEPNDILSAWTAIEVLSPQSFSKPEDIAAGNRSRIARLDKGQLPWENGGEKARDNYRLYYQIVLGSVDLPKAVAALLERYSDSRAERPPARGEAVLATIMVDQHGGPIENDAVSISSFGWGLSTALKGGLNDLEKWPEVKLELIEEIKTQIIKLDDDGNFLPLNQDAIENAYDWLLQKINLSAEFAKRPVFAVRTYQHVKEEDPPESILLNSFYLDDLDYAKKLFLSRRATPNLKRYLGVIRPENRRNLLQDKKAMIEALEPRKFPLGSWPGNGRHPLALLQQCAVNLALHNVQTDGILAVNGPPGTGKTTLLRDVIAALVTNRATVLCSFDEPESAFIYSGKRIKKSNAFVQLYKLDHRIKGFEIIVASSNNKAVENVSAELPAHKAIAEDSNLRYFKTVSDAMLGHDTWGVIAAVLGKGTNRNEFRKKFWWDNDTGLQKYLQEACGNPQFVTEKTEAGIIERKPHVIVNEKAPENHEEALKRWTDARTNFLKCVEVQQSALRDMEKIYKFLQSIEKKQEAAKNIADDIAEKKVFLTSLVDDVEKALAQMGEQKRTVEKAEQKKNILWAKRPGFFNRLFRTAPYRAWKKLYDTKWSALITAKQALAQLSNDIEVEQLNCEKIKKDIAEKQTSLDKINKDLEAGQRDCVRLTDKYPGTVISEQFFNKSHQERQKSAPWLDKATARQRNDVFEAAMNLHKAFVDCAAKPIRHNLNALMDNFAMRSLGSQDQDAYIPDIWSTLFLLVPAVSTTFASISRMFQKIDPETFGWLLIDEAGQALPQAAVGALMRTKRAIIVGDPLQIEPVVVLPEQLTAAICRQFAIDPLIYNAPGASVQTLADSATQYFSSFDTRHGDRHVGVPLLVHRRCSDPMFTISNSIAYGNMMVQAKAAVPSIIKDILGSSQWFNIEGQAQEKWCPEEGEKLLSLLQCLKNHHCMPDFYIITPFVVVQNRLRDVLRNNNVLDDWVENPDKWVDEHVGTVHTVQGREAEAVFFVLGATDAQQSGARNWAGANPNLLNVAATRAKEVLYVIGNRKLWKKAGDFQTLDKMLD